MPEPRIPCYFDSPRIMRGGERLGKRGECYDEVPSPERSEGETGVGQRETSE